MLKVEQLFIIVNSQHPIILANMQTITPLTDIGPCEAIFQILYTDFSSGEPTRLRSFKDYEAITQALLPVH